MNTPSYSDQLRAENDARQRAVLHETLINERNSVTDRVGRLRAELVTFDQAAASLKALDDPLGDVPAFVHTTGSASMVGGIPAQPVRGLVALAIGQGFEWLQRKRDKVDAEIKRATDRLTVVDKELAEKFPDATA